MFYRPAIYQVESVKSLMGGIDLSTRSEVLRNTECQPSLHPNIVSLQSFAFQSTALLLNSRGVEAVRMYNHVSSEDRWSCTFTVSYTSVTYSGHDRWVVWVSWLIIANRNLSDNVTHQKCQNGNLNMCIKQIPTKLCAQI